jgi:spore maturation protein CgeB
MIKHIDLFMPPNVSQYGVLHHFTKKMHEALLRIGVHSRILTAQRNNPKPFLAELFKEVPDCTLSFNGLLPDEEGLFFCDLIRIPHVAFLVDSPNHFFLLAKSPHTIIATVDRYAVEFYHSINARHAFFLPHGVEKLTNIKPEDNHRPYDVLMLASVIDFDYIRSLWKDKFSEAICKVMDDAAEQALSGASTFYINAFVIALDKHLSKGAKIDPSKINSIDILSELELYIRGKERLGLIKAIKDAKVDLFGASAPTATWKKLLGKNSSNVIVHEDVPFDQALELMQKSKIVLNSCAWIRNGTHERILSGLMAGAAVITDENPYMKENFADQTHIGFYRFNHWDHVNSIVNDWLANEDKRKKIAIAGREQVLHHHTWDQRVGTLLKELTPILAKLKAV